MPLPALGIEYPYLRKRPVFIREAPSFEPLWTKQATQFNPKQFETLGKLVYDCTYEGGASQLPNMPNKSRYYDKLPDFYQCKSAQDTTLIFESRFESGNLYKATQVGEFEYDLELKYDHGSSVQLT